MHVVLDATRCGCTGYCVRIAPAIFRQSGDKPAEVLTPRPDRSQWDAVREAAELCPTKAIELKE